MALHQVRDKCFETLLTADQIDARTQEIAEKLKQDYEDKNPLLIGVLNGSFIFLSDLFKYLHFDCEVTFIRVSSYTQTQSTGKVQEVLGLKEDITNRHVLLVEDIVDSGLTITEVKRQLLEKKPASLGIVTLLSKPKAHQVPIQLDYVGFEISNEFVVGYGLDYDGHGRNISEICMIKE